MIIIIFNNNEQQKKTRTSIQLCIAIEFHPWMLEAEMLTGEHVAITNRVIEISLVFLYAQFYLKLKLQKSSGLFLYLGKKCDKQKLRN